MHLLIITLEVSASSSHSHSRHFFHSTTNALSFTIILDSKLYVIQPSESIDRMFRCETSKPAFLCRACQKAHVQKTQVFL